MLEQLTIHNFGLIDHLAIDFNAGLNVLTGETGAGKSIIIDGLRFALGERIHASQIRNSKEACFVEAVFDFKNNILENNAIFNDFIPADESQLIILRQLSPEGKNKIKLNGRSITLSQLKTLGNCLVDLHGPHDHQMLLSDETHLNILDQLIHFGKIFEEYQSYYSEYCQLMSQWAELTNMLTSREREMDLLGHQIRELESVSLDDQSYEDVCHSQKRIDNAEKLFSQAASLTEIFEHDQGISEQIRRAFTPLLSLGQIDPSMKGLENTLTQIQELSDQLRLSIRDYLDSLSFEPQEAAEINRIYDLYQNLFRKFGPALKDVREFYTQVKSKYDLLVDFETNQSQLQENINSKKEKLKQLSSKMTQLRKKAAKDLKQVIESELHDLGMDHVIFEARFLKTDFHDRGMDQIVFYISPNLGEDLKPLAEIISSGESARMMLALKKALINVDPIPVLIFDEIDASIGGRLASVTGKKLKQLASSRQVILITHLPQIASFADSHFKICKNVKSGRTQTECHALDQDARVEELAHMLGAKKKSDISFKHAREMLTKQGQLR